MKNIEWKDGVVRFIDQSQLPAKEIYVETDDPAVIEDAIRTLKIRGAPALGIAAAYGVMLGICSAHVTSSEELEKIFEETARRITSTRPTARNLFWAIERLRKLLRKSNGDSVRNLEQKILLEALRIHEEDTEMCAAIGRHGSELVPLTATILTHCNTGALATGGEGTAQAVITTAFRQGKKIFVYADETRPLMQGARLTTWELMKEGIDVTLITDSTAAIAMRKKKVDLIIVGADRIAANGDTANKIGTYGLAILAKEHHIPFYVAAPTSTIDSETTSGDNIVIEERNPDEVVVVSGKRIAPNNVKVYSPAFDVTPNGLISAIITERGILRAPYGASINAAVHRTE